MLVLNRKALAFEIDLEKLKPEFLPQFSCANLMVYGVDGEYLRKEVHIDYTQGGNGYRYPWMDKKEAWLDKANRH